MKYSIGKASSVFIDQESVVKIFGMRTKGIKEVRGSYYLCWKREIECLLRLQHSSHFPKLLEKQEDHLGFRMSNCGESLFNTWREYNLNLYLDQAHAIADELEKANIQYFYPALDPEHPKPNIMHCMFPLSNFCIDEGHLSLIDFELANPVGSKIEAQLSDRLRFLYNNYSPKKFRKSLIETLKNPKISYEAEVASKLEDKSLFKDIRKINPREVYKSMSKIYTVPSDRILQEWNTYQKRYGMDQAVDRVAKMHLSDVCSNKKVLDIGCNDGYITRLVAKFAESATGVEPHVELSNDKPKNVKWIRSDFNDFLNTNTNTFDVILSLAVSIQLRDFGGLSEQQIVEGFYRLLNPGGIVVHETQKLMDRPNNQKHTDAMLSAFDKKFKLIRQGEARDSGKRLYYHFQKVV